MIADRYQITDLMNQTMKSMCPLLPKGKPNNTAITPNVDLIQKVWANTPPDSPLKRVIMYMMIYHVYQKYFEDENGLNLLSECPEFAVDVVPMLSRKYSKTTPECPHCKDVESLMVTEGKEPVVKDGADPDSKMQEKGTK